MGPLPRWFISPAWIRSCGNATGIAVAVFATAALAISASAYATPLSAAEFAQLALRCAPSVAPSTLSAIARTESGFEPLSINDNTARTSSAPATRDSAIQIASKLLEAGHSLDIGIMQVNSAKFAMLGLTLESAFDPCKSVAAGAAVLAGAYAGGTTHEGQQTALRVAISTYNTGDAQRGFANGYVHKVELAAAYVVPALDVGAGPAAIDSPPPIPVAAPSPPADPNAPPSWDVWSSFDYAAAHQQNAPAPAPATPVRGSALLAAGTEPPAAPTVPAPAVER